MEEVQENNEVVIKLEGVNILQRDHLVLSDVNLELRKGEFTYLIGKTGSGKSSLLKVLYGEIPIGKGKGEVAGFDLNKLKSKQIPFLRRKLGIVFQDFQLLSDRTVNDNLLFVLKATGWKNKQQMDVRIRKVLDMVGLMHKGYKFPHEISGGEQQRVSIARALLNDPEIVIADEPTGNLDPKTTQEILVLLHEIAQRGRAVLMATHDYANMLSFSSRIIKCEDGKLVEGNMEQI
ncbi:cell division ATP-binding protein FtsE [Luteibaculum oceani]|uniref:Cell division ATP-binding protein FtsE n=1 Tax=Luteibaculum oceani TaxID=1294296 RepID=A0A5C6VET1_9FLAO|nr:ATP-binding cassette domain-containing protein [Luteibaculum oceani]TXC81678.1 ATP-binding cassette domain-containing protein [Luteibaculum oceani]